jgi:hypothetical protein
MFIHTDSGSVKVTARKIGASMNRQFLGAVVWLLAWVLGFFVMFLDLVGHRNGSAGIFGRLADDVILFACIGGIALRIAGRRASARALSHRLRIAGSVCYSIALMAVFAILMAAMTSL